MRPCLARHPRRLRIVVSELVSSAVKYGPGTPVHVELDVSAPDRVRGGYGMRLVEALTTA